MIGIDPIVAIVMILIVLGAIALFGKVLLGLYDARAIERHERMEQALQLEAQRLRELGTRVDALHQTLPLEYVRREDWIRFGATIDAKLDRLAVAIEKIRG